MWVAHVSSSASYPSLPHFTDEQGEVQQHPPSSPQIPWSSLGCVQGLAVYLHCYSLWVPNSQLHFFPQESPWKTKPRMCVKLAMCSGRLRLRPGWWSLDMVCG